MNRLFLTGDTHGELELNRLSHNRWPESRKLTRDDIVVILGDFGMPWSGSHEERYWLDWLENCPWTTCFIDGNHEGFPMLAALPTETRFGDTVGVVSEHVLHLKRGHIYNLNGHTAFTMGGATSIDKNFRTPGFDWFPEEIPSLEECDYATERLDQANHQVDLVLTHDAPTHLVESALAAGNPIPGVKTRSSSLNTFLEIIDTQFAELSESPTCGIKRPQWYFGHYHGDARLDDHHTLVYRGIIEIV